MPVTGDQAVVLRVVGMSCAGCAGHVREALASVGVSAAEVDVARGVVRFDRPAGVDDGAVARALSAAGYPVGRSAPLQQGNETGGPATTAISGDVDYDLLVLGAGSAAFAAAIKARDAGRSVALVEAGLLGGTCVNVGCVPSKALLRAGELVWSAGHPSHPGVRTTSGPVDLAALVAAKDELVGALRQAKYADLVDDYGFEVLPGQARFLDPLTVEVDGRRLRAGAYLVATGASPWAPPVPGLAEAGYLTSTSALQLEAVPRRLAVLGANAIGLELGQFFTHLGSQVNFVEVAPRIAPLEEPEISDALTAVLREQGATVLPGAQLLSVHRDGTQRVLSVLVDGRREQIEVDELLVATGRRPNTDGLGLSAAGIEVDERGRVVTDDTLRTSNPRVWAAGDVTAAAQFVYVSAYQGALAADNALLDAGRTVDFTGLPRVIFTAPQVAGAGLTEAAARDAGYDVRISVLPLSAVPRAIVNRDTAGLVKLVADATTDRLLGASVLAESAGEVIQSAVLAIRHGLTTAELASTFHPYLTMVEGLKLAAQTFNRDVHRLSCCAA